MTHVEGEIIIEQFQRINRACMFLKPPEMRRKQPLSYPHFFKLPMSICYNSQMLNNKNLYFLCRFKGEKYDLFPHNCNNFSHETAQFLTGSGIPQHILGKKDRFVVVVHHVHKRLMDQCASNNGMSCRLMDF